MTTKCTGCGGLATIGVYCPECWEGHGRADALVELERKHKSAPAGPWKVCGDSITAASLDGAIILECDVLADPHRTSLLEFVAAARNNLPWMIERIRELERQVPAKTRVQDVEFEPDFPR